MTILRDGRVVARRDVAELSYDGLVGLVIGKPLEELASPHTPSPRNAAILEVAKLRGGSVRSLNLSVHAGEIVGLTGLAGSGAEEALRLIFGFRKAVSGERCVAGNDLKNGPSEAVRNGVGFSPGDRKRLGSIQQWTVRENLTLPRLRSSGPLRWLGARAERKDVMPWLKRFDVKPVPDAGFFTLSGGNQQKAIIATWFRSGAKVLLFEDPTVGVDVGAKGSIYAALAQAVSEGAGVLVYTSDFEEACAICDRVLVMRSGRIVATLEGPNRSVDNILAESLRSEVNKVGAVK